MSPEDTLEACSIRKNKFRLSFLITLMFVEEDNSTHIGLTYLPDDDLFHGICASTPPFLIIYILILV